MIAKAINKAFEKAIKKKWNKIYWLIDIHETIIEPNYDVGEIPTIFYPEAKEVLQLLSNRRDIVMIMYTCSWPEQIKEYEKFFKEHNIHFKYFNQNPEIRTIEGRYGYYIDKPYADVVLDDKAGFDWQTDWKIIKDTITKQPLLSDLYHEKEFKLFDMERAALWFASTKNNI